MLDLEAMEIPREPVLSHADWAVLGMWTIIMPCYKKGIHPYGTLER